VLKARDGGRGPRLRTWIAGPLGLVLTLGVAGSAVGQQPAPVLDVTAREMEAVQDLLVRATAEFEGPQQSRSIVLFDDIVARLDNLRRQGTLPDRGLEILIQAYELRGQAYFNIGLKEKAADSFRSLIQLQPQASLSKEKVSPKIVDYFNSVKRALVGYLAVSSHPAGAQVTLIGSTETRDLGLTDFFPIEVLAGEYTVEVARPGYQTETRTVSIGPRSTEALTVDLTRILASAFFITEPSGVEVWIDGEPKATTGGSLAVDLFEAVQAKGLDPARASARTEVPNLSLGSHVVEFRKKCFETVRRTLELPDPTDYETEPILLDQSLASLRLTSEPPGARIFIDGEPMGQTPRDIEGVCSGKRRLEVKHASGKFIQDIVLARNEEMVLDCPIRPSLAFLGAVAAGEAGAGSVPEAEEKLIENLSRIKSLNFVPAPAETVDRILKAEGLTRASLVASTPETGDAIRKATEKLATALEVQGFLVAVLPEERLQRTAVLHLLAAGNAVADHWEIAGFNDASAYIRFLAAVDQKTTVYRPWTGIIAVDTRLHEGVPLLRIVSGSPAAGAGVREGEVLYAVDGSPIAKTAELLAMVEGKKPGDRISLHLRSGEQTRAVDLALAETPQEIPLNDPTLLYNKVMMDLRQQVEGYPGTGPAAVARLNLALCAMHFGDYAAAHEHLLKAETELPAAPGISKGTALYYLGLSLEKLGYAKEASESYKAAAGFPEATLFNNDGPPVAPMAARRAGS
jgi:tetratricopeptide (TPR) repeat protein